MVKQIIIKLRKKGQITLPAEVRNNWNLKQNDELILIIKDSECIIKPKKRVKVKDIAGKLGPADIDETEFAVLDYELISDYNNKKYGELSEFKKAK